jgi:DnaJ-class molecular chaperone
MCHVTTILHRHEFVYVGLYREVFKEVGAGYVYECSCGEIARSLEPPVITCPVCRGDGEIDYKADNPCGDTQYRPCWKCNGKKTIPTPACETCKHAPHVPDEYGIGHCKKYGMADQCRDHGYPAHEVKP